MVISYLNCHEEYEFHNFLFKDYSGIDMPKPDIDKQPIKTIVGQEIYSQIKPHLDRALSGEEQKFDFEWHKPSDSISHLFHVTYTPDIDEKGDVRGIHVVSYDVTEQRKSEEKFKAVFQFSPNSIFITDKNGILILANVQTITMFGYEQDELIGMDVETLIPAKHKNIHKQLRSNYSQNPKPRTMGTRSGLSGLHKNGSEFPVDISLTPVNSGNHYEQTIMCTISDITERVKTESQLVFQASHDEMTGLINRNEFERRAERLISISRENETEHALCFMNLDQFKVVNDTCGHIAGNEMLRQISTLLQHEVRKLDTLARLGGDEFGVLMEHCSLNHAHRVAASLLKAIQDYQFTWEEYSFPAGMSMGLVAITPTTSSLTELLKNADAACYIAKDLGRNRIHVSHSEDSHLAHRHGEMQWVTRIYTALEEDRFCLFAQTIIPLNQSQGIHYELLLRMIDKDGKLIPPATFLPAAERYNLIENLDTWVVKKTFSFLADNTAFLQRINFLSINLSGQTLADTAFLKFIIQQFRETGIEGNKICFEITETAAISNLNVAKKFILALKALGCKFALDDFGSGLSSFAYLKNLPVNYLKIDGMFVKDIVNDPIDHAMVKSINEIGQLMGLQTIAEFVENDTIKELLKKTGINYAQGYGIGKPTPLLEILAD